MHYMDRSVSQLASVALHPEKYIRLSLLFRASKIYANLIQISANYIQIKCRRKCNNSFENYFIDRFSLLCDSTENDALLTSHVLSPSSSDCWVGFHFCALFIYLTTRILLVRTLVCIYLFHLLMQTAGSKATEKGREKGGGRREREKERLFFRMARIFQ